MYIETDATRYLCSGFHGATGYRGKQMKTARLEWKQCLILDDKIDLDEYKQIKNNLL